MQVIGVKLSMTTAHRAQRDGQIDCHNLVLEGASSCLFSYNGIDWVHHWSHIEKAHATLISTSTSFFFSVSD